MLEDSNFTYTYDDNGNLTSKTSKANGEVTTYTYDAENQLIRVNRPGLVAEYRYDALGRRIEKVVNGVSTRYAYDNEDIAVEVDGTGTAQAFYLHGPGIDEPLAMGRFGAGGGTSVFHADGLGSITTLTNTSGAPVRTYTYDSFGRLVAQTGTVTNPYTYTGRELDPESGLLYYRARYYDPQGGRFLQEDPTEFAGGDVNFYAYGTNNPLTFLDPWGLRPITKPSKKPIDLRNPTQQCGPPPPTKKDPSCPPKPPILQSVQLLAAGAIIESGVEIAKAGVLVTVSGGPVGVIVGVPVTFLGLGIVAVGVDAIPGVDLGILPPCF